MKRIYARAYREGMSAINGTAAICPYGLLSLRWIAWHFGLDAGIQHRIQNISRGIK